MATPPPSSTLTASLMVRLLKQVLLVFPDLHHGDRAVFTPEDHALWARQQAKPDDAEAEALRTLLERLYARMLLDAAAKHPCPGHALPVTPERSPLARAWPVLIALVLVCATLVALVAPWSPL